MVGSIRWHNRSGVIHPCICEESAHQKHWDKQKAHVILQWRRKRIFSIWTLTCCAVRTDWLLTPTPVKAEEALWWETELAAISVLFIPKQILVLPNSDFSSSIHLTSRFIQGLCTLRSTHSHIFSGPQAGESDIRLSGDEFSLDNWVFTQISTKK